jgi:Ca2+/Na+ antiporter
LTAQITLAVAVGAFVAPFVTERRNVLVYGWAMLLAMIVMILTLDDAIVRSEGFPMMLAYVQFVYTLYANEGGAEIAEEVIEEPVERERPPRGPRRPGTGGRRRTAHGHERRRSSTTRMTWSVVPLAARHTYSPPSPAGSYPYPPYSRLPTTPVSFPRPLRSATFRRVTADVGV